nr:MAG TPA: hypothetical protein [Caudoviricetes sp.]
MTTLTNNLRKNKALAPYFFSKKKFSFFDFRG